MRWFKKEQPSTHVAGAWPASFLACVTSLMEVSDSHQPTSWSIPAQWKLDPPRLWLGAEIPNLASARGPRFAHEDVQPGLSHAGLVFRSVNNPWVSGGPLWNSTWSSMDATWPRGRQWGLCGPLGPAAVGGCSDAASRLLFQIGSDTSQTVEENVPVLKAKVTEMRGICAKVDGWRRRIAARMASGPNAPVFNERLLNHGPSLTRCWDI
ncbi:hypothetical protein H1C71_018429 [Ictidomys tridecemlineatus]|nr:hypothetical protein H1C71_018429 [Ictidomys tridecemlineatus]